MPTKINYYLVRYVNLKTEKFHEEEMTDTQLDLLKLIGEIGGDAIQIIKKEYIKTKDLLTGNVYRSKTFN